MHDLPEEIRKARVLITVKTYPLPSDKYDELVCTAGLLNGEKWIRIYPIAFRFLQDDSKYSKYSWVKMDLIRNESDFRPESYKPRNGIDEEIKFIDKIGTEDNWLERKGFVLKETFDSMSDLIKIAKSDERKSLATIKPKEIVDFKIEADSREWKKEWLMQSKQGNIFELDDKGSAKEKNLVRKLPYKFYYEFLTEGDVKPRKMLIEDWEIGALYWNCLHRADGDEEEAKRLVKKKYLTIFREEKDLYFFVGTTKRFHLVAPNPFAGELLSILERWTRMPDKTQYSQKNV